MASNFRTVCIRYPHMPSAPGQAGRKKAGVGECVQSHISDLTHTLQWDSVSSNPVYCLTLFILLSASSVSLSTFPKHKNIMFVTAAVSPTWNKAEYQHSICLSERHKREVQFAVPWKLPSYFMEDWFLQTRVSFRIQNLNSLLLPEAQGPGSCFQGFCSSPLLLPQGAGCSGAQLPPWWCLHGCLLPSGPWCPCWAGENTTTSPSEPAAPWTTAKGTGEGQGQLPQEQRGACHPLGWPWGHTNPPAVPTAVPGADVPPAAGTRLASPEAGCTHMVAHGTAKVMFLWGTGWCSASCHSLTHTSFLDLGFETLSECFWLYADQHRCLSVMFGFRIQTPVVIFYNAIHPHTTARHSLTGLQQMLHLKHTDKSGFCNFKIKIWKILTASLQRCTRVELTPSFFFPPHLSQKLCHIPFCSIHF